MAIFADLKQFPKTVAVMQPEHEGHVFILTYAFFWNPEVWVNCTIPNNPSGCKGKPTLTIRREGAMKWLPLSTEIPKNHFSLHVYIRNFIHFHLRETWQNEATLVNRMVIFIKCSVKLVKAKSSKFSNFYFNLK